MLAGARQFLQFWQEPIRKQDVLKVVHGPLSVDLSQVGTARQTRELEKDRPFGARMPTWDNSASERQVGRRSLTLGFRPTTIDVSSYLV